MGRGGYMVRLGMLVAILAGCAEAPPIPSQPPPIRITPEQVAAQCRTTQAIGDEQKPLPFQYYVDCPMPAGYVMEDIFAGALRSAAILGAFFESDEFMAVRITDPPAGWFRVFAFYGPKPGFFDEYRKSAHKLVYFLKPGALLPPDLYAEIQERLEMGREDAAYGECKVLILNVEESTKDPARAQACANTMAVVDRTRTERRQRKEHEQEMAVRRVELQEARRQHELDRLAIQQQTERIEEMERRRQRAEATKALGDAFHPSQTTTRCRPDYAGGVKCTTSRN